MSDTRHRPTSQAEPGQRLVPSRVGWWWAGLIGLAIAVVGLAAPTAAQESDEIDARWNSERCLGCHDDNPDTLPLPSGEQLRLGVDQEAFESSTHHANGVDCAHCHTTITPYPHPEIPFPDARAFTLEISKSCNLCHWPEAIVAPDQAHALVAVELRSDVPVCADCHDAHATMAVALDDPEMQQVCAQCHAEGDVAEVTAIHVAATGQAQDVDPPPLVLFYLLIAAAIVLVISVGWGAVLGVQWVARRVARTG